jgi:hypothetical protein
MESCDSGLPASGSTASIFVLRFFIALLFPTRLSFMRQSFLRS